MDLLGHLIRSPGERTSAERVFRIPDPSRCRNGAERGVHGFRCPAKGLSLEEPLETFMVLPATALGSGGNRFVAGPSQPHAIVAVHSCALPTSTDPLNTKEHNRADTVAKGGLKGGLDNRTRNHAH